MPVVIKMWKEEQEKLVKRLCNLIGGGVVLSGNGRFDSLGHSTKYGASTVIEQMINKVFSV